MSVPVDMWLCQIHSGVVLMLMVFIMDVGM
jgi:hypothetical protein